MKKRISVLIMALMMILCSFSSVFAYSADPNITIVNPPAGSSITSSSLLISVKIRKPETVKVSVYKENPGTQQWQSIFQSDNFRTSSNLTFYTKKIENVGTGSYMIKVQTLGNGGRVIYDTSTRVTVKGKGSAGSVFTKNGNGAVNSFIQSLLKSVFSN